MHTVGNALSVPPAARAGIAFDRRMPFKVLAGGTIEQPPRITFETLR